MQTARKPHGGKAVRRTRATLDHEELVALTERERSSSPMKMKHRKTTDHLYGQAIPGFVDPNRSPKRVLPKTEASFVDLMNNIPLERVTEFVVCVLVVCCIAYVAYTEMLFVTESAPPPAPPPAVTRSKVFSQWLSQIAAAVGY